MNDYFEERVQSLKTKFEAEFDTDTIPRSETLNNFGCSLSRDEWFEIAEEYATKICADTGVSYRFFSEPNHIGDNSGLMGRCINSVYCMLFGDRLTFADYDAFIVDRDAINGAVDSTMKHHDFTAKTVPPVLLVRELLTLEVQYNQVYDCLRESLPNDTLVEFFEAVRQIHNSSVPLENPEDATVLDRNKTFDLLDSLIV